MKKAQTPGQVTVRSNVVTDGSRWDLVPGELLHALGRSRNATRLQREEHMYYQPCSVCDRTIAEINLTGCTRCTHAPSPSAVLGAQEAHRERVAQSRRREANENAVIAANTTLPMSGTSFDPPLDHSAGEGPIDTGEQG